MEIISLLIASDNATYNEGLNAIFLDENTFNTVAIVPLDDASEKCTFYQPDILLFFVSGEYQLAGKQVKEVKRTCPFTLTMAVINTNHNEGLFELLNAGIDGCMPRDITKGHLVNAIELACKAGVFCIPRMQKGIQIQPREPGPVIIAPQTKLFKDENGAYEGLTPRETEILELMAQSFSNKEIGHRLFISEPTVKTHVSSILRKLGKTGRAKAVLYAYEIGLLGKRQDKKSFYPK